MKICKLHKNAVVPTYAHENDACFDLYAATIDGFSGGDATVFAGAPLLCGTGLAFEIPVGFAMLVFSRSGHGIKHGVRLSNCVGVIDSGYAGEVMVKLTRDTHPSEQRYKVSIGDRIAQAMIIPVGKWAFEVVEQLGLTERGAGGFGSSGS